MCPQSKSVERMSELRREIGFCGEPSELIRWENLDSEFRRWQSGGMVAAASAAAWTIRATASG
jgi:hypothetical protein